MCQWRRNTAEISEFLQPRQFALWTCQVTSREANYHFWSENREDHPFQLSPNPFSPHLRSAFHPGSLPSCCSGTLRCKMVQVQAIIVKRLLQSMSKVPRPSGETTKLTSWSGDVQFGVKVVCSWRIVARENRKPAPDCSLDVGVHVPR